MTEPIEATEPTELAELTATRLLDGYRKGEFSPVDATRAALERAEQLQPVVNAFVRIDADSALAQARDSAERWRRGGRRGSWTAYPRP